MHEIYIAPCTLSTKPDTSRCAQAHLERVVYGSQDLLGPWSGWRLTGREIVTPDNVRIRRELLRFLIAREVHAGNAQSRHRRFHRRIAQWEVR